MTENQSKFLRKIYEYGESFGLTRKEVLKALVWFIQGQTPTSVPRGKDKKEIIMESDKNLNAEIEQRIFDFHDHLVEEILTFIKNTPEIKNTINEVYEIRKKELKFNPDVCINLSLDGAKESIEKGQWISSMDSSLYIGTGGETIAWSM